MRIRRFPQAVRDVDEVWDWIAADDLAAADRMVARIAGATQRLADCPEGGTPRPEIAPDARGVVVGSYLILYRFGPDSVDILRVVHGARDLTALLARNGKE